MGAQAARSRGKIGGTYTSDVESAAHREEDWGEGSVGVVVLLVDEGPMLPMLMFGEICIYIYCWLCVCVAHACIVTSFHM